MTAFNKLKTLQAAVAKELTDLKKKRDAAKAKAQAAFDEYKKLEAQVTEREALLGGSTPAPKAPTAAPAPAKKVGRPKGSKNAPKAQAAPAPGVRLKKDGTPAKKPGPPKKAETKAAAPAPAKNKGGRPKGSKNAPKAAAPAPVKAKAAPAKKAPAKAAPAKPAKKTPKNRAAEGRRAVLAGERPTLKDAMKQVMGSRTMNSQEVYDALKAKGWLPNSTEPKNYIGYSLSSMKDHFERVPDKGRGFYRVRGSATNGTAKVETKAPEAPSASDQSLADAAEILGVN